MIELCFDFVSPYAYLACATAAELGVRTGRVVEPTPVLFAGMLDHLGTRGPAEVPARRAWLMKDVVRKAHHLGVTITLPPAHPFNPLMALRVSSLPLEREVRWRIISALFAAAWGRGEGIDTADGVRAALARVDIDAVPLLERALGQTAKDRVRESTAEALRRGAFGVPTYFVSDEVFFGVDSMGDLERFLRGEDPAASSDVIERWSSLPAAAQRQA